MFGPTTEKKINSPNQQINLSFLFEGTTGARLASIIFVEFLAAIPGVGLIRVSHTTGKLSK